MDVFIFFTLCNSCHARESFGKSWTDGCMACCEFCYTDLPLNNPKKMRAFNSIKPMVTLNPPASHIQNDHSLCSWTHSFPSHSFSFGEGPCTYFISFFFFFHYQSSFFFCSCINLSKRDSACFAKIEITFKRHRSRQVFRFNRNFQINFSMHSLIYLMRRLNSFNLNVYLYIVRGNVF